MIANEEAKSAIINFLSKSPLQKLELKYIGDYLKVQNIQQKNLKKFIQTNEILKQIPGNWTFQYEGNNLVFLCRSASTSTGLNKNTTSANFSEKQSSKRSSKSSNNENSENNANIANEQPSIPLDKGKEREKKKCPIMPSTASERALLNFMTSGMVGSGSDICTYNEEVMTNYLQSLPNANSEDYCSDDELEMINEHVGVKNKYIAETKPLENAVIFTRSVLKQVEKEKTSNASTSQQYGLLGSLNCNSSATERVYINCNSPFSAVICGLQGAGKSHSISTLLENFLIPHQPGIGQVTTPLSALVCHVDASGGHGCNFKPCEAVYLAMPPNSFNASTNTPLGKRHRLLLKPVTVLVSPSNYENMRKVYGNIPNVVVEPLFLSTCDLDAARMMSLMAVNEKDGFPLYMHVVYKLLRELGDQFEYDKFRDMLKAQNFTFQQTGPLQMRLELLDSFLLEKVCKMTGKDLEKIKKRRFVSLFEPGKLVILDLTDPFMDSDCQAALFDIMLGMYLENAGESYEDEGGYGKVVVLDEAHKYLVKSGKGSSSDRLVENVLRIVRQQRHLGVRTLISTQDPTQLNPSFLHLAQLVMVHRISAPIWWKFLAQHLASSDVSLSQNWFNEVVQMETGEAMLFAPNGLVHRRNVEQRDESQGLLNEDEEEQICKLANAFLTGKGTEHRKNPKYPLGAHRSITMSAFGRHFQDVQVQAIYKGDFIRDLSQTLDGKMSKRLRFQFLLDALIKLEYGDGLKWGKSKKNEKDITGHKLKWSDIGFYDSTEHIDQPSKEKKSLHSDDQLDIDLSRNMMNYIRTEKGDSYPTTSMKIRNNLMKSFNIWRSHLDKLSKNEIKEKKTIDAILDDPQLVRDNFFLHIGSTSHTLGDYFAHSNFMELAFMQELMRANSFEFDRVHMKKYNDLIFPYVGTNKLAKCAGYTGDMCYPVVTGLSSRNFAEFRATILSVLKTKMKSMTASLHKSKSWFKRRWESIKNQVIDNVSDAIDSDSKETNKNNVGDMENPDFTWPTHFQLNKDHSSHPLHLMAVNCATFAIESFALKLRLFLEDSFEAKSKGVDGYDIEAEFSKVIDSAMAVLTHPYHVNAVESKNSGMALCIHSVRDFVLNDSEDNRKIIDMLSRKRAVDMTNRYF